MPADFITSWMENVADVSSPALFKQWAGITAVAGALERRCWVKTRKGAIFPNLFTLLVASPGIGKTEAINLTAEFWKETKKLHVAPKRLSSAALVDNLKEAVQIKIGGGKFPNYEFSSLQMPIPEFSTFIQAYDTDILGVISDIYDCPPDFSEKRRHNNDGKLLEIIAPQLNIIAGVQPSFMARVLPEEAWGQGFTSRLVMIYSGQADEHGSLWGDNPSVSKAQLHSQMTSMTQMYGQFEWSDASKLAIDLWYKGGQKPVPDHSKLINYNTRRILHAMKLIMVSCVSRSAALRIDVVDVERGLGWLFEAERRMPDIFREMVQKSDTDIVNELHFSMWRSWITGDQKPLHQSMLWHFLQYRVPSEKIPRIIEVAERANFIKRSPLSNEHWIPQPKQMHGVE